jgi:hypothetical protein
MSVIRGRCGEGLSRARPLVVAVGAGLLYGAWAAFTNHSGGVAIAVRAAATQAAVSLTATLVMVLVVERLFRCGATPVRGFWLSWLGASALLITVLVTCHILAQTPSIPATITPPFLIGTAFYCGYARMLLTRAKRVSAVPEGKSPGVVGFWSPGAD